MSIDNLVPPPATLKGMGPVVPVLARRGDFMPTVLGWINITLDGETVRAVVEEVVSRDVIVVKIDGLVLNKTGHGIKRGDIVACERRDGPLSEIWCPVSERDVKMREDAERLAHEAAAKITMPAPAIAPVPVPAPQSVAPTALPPAPAVAPVLHVRAWNRVDEQNEPIIELDEAMTNDEFAARVVGHYAFFSAEQAVQAGPKKRPSRKPAAKPQKKKPAAPQRRKKGH